jgi:membrane protein YqaA with SNARE-associated domain
MKIKQLLKQKTEKFVHSKHLMPSVAFASFLESIIVPIPLEAILIPLMQSKREQIWMITLMALMGCVIGAIVGYAVGYFLFDLFGDWLINIFSSQAQFEAVQQKMQSHGFWFVVSVGVIPIPFQIAMLAAGATNYSLFSFVLATLIARSIRYFGLAAVVYYFGNQAEALIRKYKTKLLLSVTGVVIALWWAFNTFG